MAPLDPLRELVTGKHGLASPRMTAEDLLSEEAHRLEVLKRRAEALARCDQQDEARTLVDTAVVVEVGNERFGIRLPSLCGIVPVAETAELPGLPSWIFGIVQIRGRLLAVLDLAEWFNVASPSKPRHLVVVESRGRQLALLVDSIIDIINVHTDDLATTLAFDESSGRRAITKDLVTLIDVDTLLKSERLIVDQINDEADR